MPEQWPKPMAVVEVIWRDAKAGGGWSSPRQYRHDYTTAMQCRSVGYLLQGGKKDHLLVLSVASDGNVADSIVIPKVAIERVVELRPKGKRWPQPR